MSSAKGKQVYKVLRGEGRDNMTFAKKIMIDTRVDEKVYYGKSSRGSKPGNSHKFHGKYPN